MKPQKKQSFFGKNLFKSAKMWYNGENKKTDERDTMNRKALLIWIAAHLALFLGVLLFPRYLQVSTGLFSVFFGCILHDFAHLYCPFCGGTRSLGAILRGSFGEAFRFHALLPVFLLGALIYDGIILYRILKGEKLPLRIPKPLAIGVLVAIGGYWILRNVLLIAFGIDPIGDLYLYWHG